MDLFSSLFYTVRNSFDVIGSEGRVRPVHMHGCGQVGISAVELLVVLAITGMLSVLAVPDLSRFLDRHRASVEINEFVCDINFARSAAVSRGARVTMCKSVDGWNCAQEPNQSWDMGWIVFEESVEANGAVDEGEEIIRACTRKRSAESLKGNSPIRDYISFTPSGAPRKFDGGLQIGTITMKRKDGMEIDLVINSMGRLRIDRKEAK
jgi:type IV fimbrial biogenesis protein FimT